MALGTWTSPINWDIKAIHLTLRSNGTLLTWGSPEGDWKVLSGTNYGTISADGNKTIKAKFHFWSKIDSLDPYDVFIDTIEFGIRERS